MAAAAATVVVYGAVAAAAAGGVGITAVTGATFESSGGLTYLGASALGGGVNYLLQGLGNSAFFNDAPVNLPGLLQSMAGATVTAGIVRGIDASINKYDFWSGKPLASPTIESLPGGIAGAEKTAAEIKTDLHHIVTDKSQKFTPELMKITDKYGLSLNDTWNKVELPSALHTGRHVSLYHRWV